MRLRVELALPASLDDARLAREEDDGPTSAPPPPSPLEEPGMAADAVVEGASCFLDFTADVGDKEEEDEEIAVVGLRSGQQVQLQHLNLS